MTMSHYLRRLAPPLLTAALALIAAACGGDDDLASVEANETESGRPYQYVLLAYDGSKSLNRWRESREFAASQNVRFTYFISGVYFLSNANKSVYDAPQYGVGKSAIGFGGEPDAIAARLEQLNLAKSEGHEIASHANGHYDGSAWTAEQWTAEHQQFDELIFNASQNNGAELPELSFDASSITGFRAPQLGRGAGLYASLADNGFSYDTSKTNSPDYWPERQNGVWNFPLAQLRIVGSNKRTLSMDYNFYVADSGAERQPENKELFQRRMVDTYMAYFESNYFGNRAPVHIGHHFSKWNGGAYWDALEIFAQRVCSLPEVVCGTYQELAEYLETHEDRISSWRGGDFPQMPRPPGAETSEDIDPGPEDDDNYGSDPDHVHDGSE
jgi:hypothetical protein